MSFPVELKKFGELFISSTDFVNTIKTRWNINYDGDLDVEYLTLLYHILSSTYIDTPTLYDTVEKGKNRFALKAISSSYFLSKKLKTYTAKLLSVDDSEFIRDYKTELDSENTFTTTQEGSSKVARNPVDIVLDGTDFVDEYANENWKSANSQDSSGTTARDFARLGNVSKLLEAFASMPKNIIDEVVETFAGLFYPILYQETDELKELTWEV